MRQHHSLHKSAATAAALFRSSLLARTFYRIRIRDFLLKKVFRNLQ